MKTIKEFILDSSYLIEGRTDYIDTCNKVKEYLKNTKYPKANEKQYIELDNDRKIVIWNDPKRKSIEAVLLRNDNIVDRTHEGFWYGKEYLSGKEISEEDAFNNLKERLSKNNINMYDK